MAKYNPGQKVIFKSSSTVRLPYMNLPSEGEIVTIHSYYRLLGIDCYRVEGYIKSLTGNDQVINQRALHPIVFDSAASEIILKFPMTEEKSDTEIKQVPQKELV